MRGRSPTGKGNKNLIILGGIVAAIGIGIAYGAASGAFSSLSAKAPQNEPIVMHIHPHLRIIIEGNSVTIPQNIGIDSALYKGHDLDVYGMKNPRWHHCTHMIHPERFT